MKRIIKTLCCLLMAILMPCVCIGLTACEDIAKLEIKISVYDTSEKQQKELVLNADLYRHLAPDTVDKIISYVEKGYYNDTLFFRDSNYNNIMVGDFKVVDGKIERNIQDYVEPIYGEFSANGVEMKGDWENVEGSIGLWRTWQADGSYSSNSDASFNSGMATWYMPTDAKAEYNGYFCVFGKIDISEIASENEANLNVLQSTIYSTDDYYRTYVEYYTGETTVKEDGSIDYSGLEYHMIYIDDYTENYDEEEKTIFGEKLFEAKGAELVKYNRRDVRLPVAELNGKISSVYAKIVSVKVV